MSMATTVPMQVQIEYPESDGMPMAETQVHVQAMVDALETLSDFFRADPNVYVNANMLLYYEEGNFDASVAPDVFVTRGIPKEPPRRTYRLWVEGRPPTFVLELTSRGTRLEDQGTKRALYTMIGVREYFLFDPLDEYLKPPLQGFRLADGEYERTEPDADGSLLAETLSLRLRIEGKRLRLVVAATGQRLLWPDEVSAQLRAEAEARRAAEQQARAEAEGRRAAEQQARAEAEARRAAEQRAAEAEAELARLRAELARLRGESSANQ